MNNNCFIFLLQSKIRGTYLGKILMGEFFSLVCFHILFLCVLSIDRWTSDPEVKEKTCLTLLIIFHYSTLTCACLISMCGIALHLTILNNFNMESSSSRLMVALWVLGKNCF